MIKLYVLVFFGMFVVAESRGQAGIGALHIGAGTLWASSPDTYVVLDQMDLQYDADPTVLLNNVFRFTGSNLNSIRGENRPLLYAICVNKPSPGQLWLNQAVTVAGRVNFESGFFNLNDNGLFLRPAALLTNERNNNQLVGPFGGYVTIDADIRAGITINPGNLGAAITSTTNLGKTTITRGHEVPYLDSIHVGIARSYDIEPAAGTPVDAILRFFYFPNESEGLAADSLVMYQHGDESAWKNIGYTSRDQTKTFVEKQGLTALGHFTLSNSFDSSTRTPPGTGSSGPMLLAGVWVGNFAALNWTIPSEYDDQFFNVERKYSTQSDFQAIASIPTKAPGGTSASTQFYTYTDSSVKTSPDDISYRIRRVAAGGEAAFSNIVTLKAHQDSSSVFIHKLYPTFVYGGRVYIEVGNMPIGKVTYMIVDAKGSIVRAGELPYVSQWIPVHDLGRGVYRIVLLSTHQKWHGTFIR